MARSPELIELGIARLQERIEALQNFDIHPVAKAAMPELTALSAAIADTLDRCFMKDSSAYRRFKPAAALRPVQPGSYGSDFNLRVEIRENIERSIALLKEAQRALREDLKDTQHLTPQAAASSATSPVSISRRVFVVHGHDEGARETVARFLDKIGFEPVILHRYREDRGLQRCGLCGGAADA
jgi:uncharacterized membrane protein YccC